VSGGLGDRILYDGAQSLWVLGKELASWDFFGKQKLEAASTMLGNFWSPVQEY